MIDDVLTVYDFSEAPKDGTTILGLTESGNFVAMFFSDKYKMWSWAVGSSFVRTLPLKFAYMPKMIRMAIDKTHKPKKEKDE